MWKIVELLFLGLFILGMITEVFIPLFFNKPFFGSFRKTKVAPEKTFEKTFIASDIDSELEVAKSKVKEVHEIQTKVDKHYDKASKLKKESENIFHKVRK